MISVNTGSNPKHHIRIIFGLDLRKFFVVLAPEGRLPVLLESIGLVGVGTRIWRESTEGIDADFTRVFVTDRVDVGFAPCW